MEQKKYPDFKAIKTKGQSFLKDFSNLSSQLRQSVEILLQISEFACRHTSILKLLVQEDLTANLTIADFQNQWEAEFPGLDFIKKLRLFRHKHFLRLLLREILQFSTIEETLTSWSDCADFLITKALTTLTNELKSKYGCPRDEENNPVKLHVIAMGKLGGRELNLSSDIDLIFTYSAGGKTNGGITISNQEFYTKLIQRFIQVFQDVTHDGFVFRVDLRLRPNGSSAPLIISLKALEIYYQDLGRDWERYAMVKARIIGEKLIPGHWYYQLIIPFVYRRYIDFSVIGSLRTMKALIEKELRLDPGLEDIKRGLGGIREIEFIIQSIQLIRGGRSAVIREPSTIKALKLLKEENLLSHTDVLKQAYLFFRKIENGLQCQNDQQVHVLPTNPIYQAQLLTYLQFSDWETFITKLHQYQRIISSTFKAILGKTESDNEDKNLQSQLQSIWEGHIETTMAINILNCFHFQEAKELYQVLTAFRNSPKCSRLGQVGRTRLNSIMVNLLIELKSYPNQKIILLNFIKLLEHVIGKTAYLALLTENNFIIKELFYWFSNSNFVTNLLINFPFLLEVLLQKDASENHLSKKKLFSLQNLVKEESNKEQAMEVLGQFKLIHWFIAVRSYMLGKLPAINLANVLTNIAQSVLLTVIDLCFTLLEEKYPAIGKLKSKFSVLAYGKLGSKEMNFNSDLDLVFLHEVKPEEEKALMALTQKIIYLLTTYFPTGRLYQVDTRLRPSGSAGLLLSNMQAFGNYQLTQAWTWEHQALLKARLIYGSRRQVIFLANLKKKILTNAKDSALLKKDIDNMYIKIHQQSNKDPIFLIKNSLIKIEFLIQYLLLSSRFLETVKFTNNLSFLKFLYKKNILPNSDYLLLKKAYLYFQDILYINIISPNDKIKLKYIDEIESFYNKHLIS